MLFNAFELLIRSILFSLLTFYTNSNLRSSDNKPIQYSSILSRMLTDFSNIVILNILCISNIFSRFWIWGIVTDAPITIDFFHLTHHLQFSLVRLFPQAFHVLPFPLCDLVEQEFSTSDIFFSLLTMFRSDPLAFVSNCKNPEKFIFYSLKEI